MGCCVNSLLLLLSDILEELIASFARVQESRVLEYSV